MRKPLSKAELNALQKGQVGTKQDLETTVKDDEARRSVQRTEIMMEHPSYDRIGGYSTQKEELSFVGNVARHNELYQDSYGQIPNRGVYLVGPNGVGKTMMAKALIREHYDELAKENPNLEIVLRGDQGLVAKASEKIGQISDKIKSRPKNTTFYYDIVDAGLLVGGAPQITEKILSEYLENAVSSDYAVVVLERIEGLLPAEGTNGSNTQVGHLTDIIKHYLQKYQNLVVIGTTSKPSNVDSQVYSVLTKKIEMGAPDDLDRKDIIEVFIDGQPIAEDFDLEELVKLTAGYVGSDIGNVCDESIKSSSRRSEINQKLKELKQKYGEKYKESHEYLKLIESQEVTMTDFKEALSKVKPSLLLGYTIEVPDIKLEDIAGMEEIKKDTELWMKTRINHPWIYEACGLPASSNKYWLMTGPPGTGKTLYAKALAGEEGATFIAIKGPEVLDMWVGSTEQKIREIFKRAREAKKAVIFWDEVESIASKRGSGQHHDDNFVTSLLTELEGVTENENIVFISATNRPDQLDTAFTSRMHRMIYLGLPDTNQIHEIIKINLGLTENPRHAKNAPKQIEPDLINGLEEFAAELERRNFSGRDITHLIKGAKESMAKRLSERVNNGASDEEIQNACMLTREDLNNSLEEIIPKTYDDAYWEKVAGEYKLKGFKSKKEN